MALQAEVCSGLRANVAVWVVAGRTGESMLTEDLVRMGNFLKLGHAAVAPVADLGSNGAEFPRSRSQCLHVNRGGFLLIVLLLKMIDL
jgi:hypothetical protein